VSIKTWNPQTLPVDDNINKYAFSIDLHGDYFVQQGKMIAYYGQIKFNALTVGSISDLIASKFSAPIFTGDFMVCSGQGKLILGDRGFDINSYDLDKGNLTVRAGNLLGFDPSGLELKQSIIPGFLTLIGSGKFLASSNGAVHFAWTRRRSSAGRTARRRAITTTRPTCAGSWARRRCSRASAASPARSTSSTSPATGP